METINDRMEMLVNERFGGNKAAFAKAIDLTPTAISSYLGTKRRSKPSVEMVTNIVTKLNVDAYWLLTGEKREQDNVEVADLKKEIAELRLEVERLKNLKLPTANERALDVSMKFFEAAKEMFTYYNQMEK